MPISKTLQANKNIQQIYMSHNKMSGHAIKLLSAGLQDNTVLTDFFFTHNDLSETPDESLIFIKCLENK